jgi:hypothetical protein
MKLFYCGFNGFGQIKSTNLNYNEKSVKVDCCWPTPIFETETDSFEVFLGWSRLIITTSKAIDLHI